METSYSAAAVQEHRGEGNMTDKRRNMISGGGHREGIFFFWFLHVSFAPTCWMIIINLLSYLSTARLSWYKDINIRKWWRRKMMLLSRVTLPHMKTKSSLI